MPTVSKLSPPMMQIHLKRPHLAGLGDYDTPEIRAAKIRARAAEERSIDSPTEANVQAANAARLEVGRLLLARDRAERPHIYAK